MLCENCGKNTATTYVKRIINGVATSKHLCSQCAGQYGITAGGGFASLLSSMFGDILSENQQLREKNCGKCGMSFRGIVNSGKVGCEECYTQFYNELAPYLKRVHGSVKHVGKVPNNAPLAVVPQETELETLRHKLHSLVAAEEFEQAATVRDRIKELERQEKQNG